MTKEEIDSKLALKEAYDQALDELISCGWSEEKAMEYLAIPEPDFNTIDEIEEYNGKQYDECKGY